MFNRPSTRAASLAHLVALDFISLLMKTYILCHLIFLFYTESVFGTVAKSSLKFPI
jgi:hypothetical protein